MQNTVTTNHGHELSWLLIPYLLMLLSVLMLVHVLQPERDGPGSSSRSPVHQERQNAAKPAASAQPGANAAPIADRRAHWSSADPG